MVRVAAPAPPRAGNAGNARPPSKGAAAFPTPNPARPVAAAPAPVRASVGTATLPNFLTFGAFFFTVNFLSGMLFFATNGAFFKAIFFSGMLFFNASFFNGSFFTALNGSFFTIFTVFTALNGSFLINFFFKIFLPGNLMGNLMGNFFGNTTGVIRGNVNGTAKGKNPSAGDLLYSCLPPSTTLPSSWSKTSLMMSTSAPSLMSQSCVNL